MKDLNRLYDVRDWVGIAYTHAERAHQWQFRQDGKTPYIEHPKRVAAMVAHKGPEYEVVACLHDVIEDTDWTSQRLFDEGWSKEIVKTIELLTKGDQTSYIEYINDIKSNELARVVKLADIFDNLADDPTEAQRKKYVKAITILTKNEPVPVDFYGQPLKVGDFVAFGKGGYKCTNRNLVEGEVMSIGKKALKVRFAADYNPAYIVYRFPRFDQVVKRPEKNI